MNTYNEALMLIVHDQRASELQNEATTHRIARYGRVRRARRWSRRQSKTGEVYRQPWVA